MKQWGHLPSQLGMENADSSHWTGGYVADGFEPVANAFQASILSGEALGAACTIIHRGETLVDLYGGWKESACTQVWGEDDIALVYSLTKGLTGMAAAVAVSRGLFAYDKFVRISGPSLPRMAKRQLLLARRYLNKRVLQRLISSLA